MSKEFYLNKYVNADAIFEVASADKESVLKEISQHVFNLGLLTKEADKEVLYKKLLERENLGSTAIIPHIAIPHCKVDFTTSDMVVLVSISKKGIEFGSHDGKPVNLIFTVLTRKNMPTLHLSALAAISRMISNYSISSNIEKYSNKEEIQGILNEFKYGI